MNHQTQNSLSKGLSRRQMLQLLGTAAGMSALAACVAPPAGAPAAGGEAAPAAAPKKMCIRDRRTTHYSPPKFPRLTQSHFNGTLHFAYVHRLGDQAPFPACLDSHGANRKASRPNAVNFTRL